MVEEFATALNASRLHHAWIIYGHRGHDKLALIWQLLELWLRHASYGDAATNVALNKMRQGSHPDFQLLSASGNEDAKTKIITVEQVREANKFLRMTTVEAPGRVLVIDSLDDLNVNAANGLLKSLEEPPSGTLLLLICNVLGGILPTIRSRCRILRVPNVAMAEFREALQRQQPQLLADDIAMLAEITQGSLTMAEHICQHNLLDDCRRVANVFYKNSKCAAEVLQIAKMAKQNEHFWRLLGHLIPHFMRAKIKEQPLAANTEQKLNFLTMAERFFDDANKMHLDKEHVITSILAVYI